jgi:cyclopropane fatty-acyl-phospholipid synthase-like methyltransferase
MDKNVYQNMMEYYNDRAQEHDEVYDGGGPATLKKDSYIHDVNIIKDELSKFGNSHVADIACGAGYWLPWYIENCNALTLVDQSANMLNECKNRIEEMDLSAPIQYNQMDVLYDAYQGDYFDSVFVGFLLSHFEKDDELKILENIKSHSNRPFDIIIVDSIWNKARESANEIKEGKIERALNDGRKYSIYKKYFTLEDMIDLCSAAGIKIEEQFLGRAFILIKGKCS